MTDLAIGAAGVLIVIVLYFGLVLLVARFTGFNRLGD